MYFTHTNTIITLTLQVDGYLGCVQCSPAAARRVAASPNCCLPRKCLEFATSNTAARLAGSCATPAIMVCLICRAAAAFCDPTGLSRQTRSADHMDEMILSKASDVSLWHYQYTEIK